MPTGQAAETDATSPAKPLTKLQEGFAHHFARLWKAAPAYRLAGGAEKGAKQNGQNLLKDERIQAAIKAEAAALGMTVEESTVRMSEWGRVTIDDVMTKVEVEYTTKVRKPLAEVIQQLEDEIAFERDFAERSAQLLGLSEDELSDHMYDFTRLERRLRLKILRYQMRLEKDPAATEEVDGPKATRAEVHLDLVKVYDAKAGHMIKKVTPTKYGQAVELHAAKDAVNTMLKIHGAFAPVKVDHTTNGNDLPGSNIMMPDNGRD